MESIVNEARGRNIDVNLTLKQIGVATLMSVGAQMKTLTYDTDYVKFKVSGRFWLVVKLNAADTFDIEVGRVRKVQGLPTYEVIEQSKDVPVENLSKVVRELDTAYTLTEPKS